MLCKSAWLLVLQRPYNRGLPCGENQRMTTAPHKAERVIRGERLIQEGTETDGERRAGIQRHLFGNEVGADRLLLRQFAYQAITLTGAASGMLC